MKPIVVTSGEPAGIGPELIALMASDPDKLPPVPVVALGNVDLFESRAKKMGLEPNWQSINHIDHVDEPGYFLLNEPLHVTCIPGEPTDENAHYVLNMLDLAVDLCLLKKASAMVTLPIQKSIINPVWPGFKGHTEYLAQRCACDQVVMMLQGAQIRVALVTTHLPLRDVPKAITFDSIIKTVQILNHDLIHRFGIQTPHILVTGLNPHAGEGGLLGSEEKEIISPALRKLQQQGLNISGPYPADTLFQPKYLKQADAILAMYHDQGLTALKYACFGQGVNVTLGLPIIRTSVDHGTALNLVGTQEINTGSFEQALVLAIQLSRIQHAASRT